MSEKKYIDGLWIKPPREGAPNFVKGNMSFNVEKLMGFLQGKKAAGEEWVNIDLLESDNGSLYAKENLWKPSGERKQREKPSNYRDDVGDEIPMDDSDNLPF